MKAKKLVFLDMEFDDIDKFRNWLDDEYFDYGRDWDKSHDEEIYEAEREWSSQFELVRTGTVWNGEDEYFPSYERVLKKPTPEERDLMIQNIFDEKAKAEKYLKEEQEKQDEI